MTKLLIYIFISLLSTLSFAENSSYIPDHINILTSEKSFLDLDVVPSDLARWINSTDEIFADTFKDDIKGKNSENKIIGITIALSAIHNSKSTCIKDYTKCVQMNINVQYSSNIPEKQRELFMDKINNLKEIKINNYKSNSEAALMSYMNTKKQ